MQVSIYAYMRVISGFTYALPAIIMPDDVAEEKVKALHALGAEVIRVRPASIVDTKHVRLPLLIIGTLITTCAVRRKLCNY